MIITVLWKLRKQEIVCLHSEVTASNSHVVPAMQQYSEVTASNSHVVPAMQQSELENKNRTDQKFLMLLGKKCKILTIVKSAMPPCWNSLCKSVHLIVKTMTKLIVLWYLWNYLNSRTSNWNLKEYCVTLKPILLDSIKRNFFL